MTDRERADKLFTALKQLLSELEDVTGIEQCVQYHEATELIEELTV